MIGTPWTIVPVDKGYHLREYSGFIYGYNSYMVMVPEIKLGKLLHSAPPPILRGSYKNQTKKFIYRE